MTQRGPNGDALLPPVWRLPPSPPPPPPSPDTARTRPQPLPGEVLATSPPAAYTPHDCAIAAQYTRIDRWLHDNEVHIRAIQETCRRTGGALRLCNYAPAPQRPMTRPCTPNQTWRYTTRYDPDCRRKADARPRQCHRGASPSHCGATSRGRVVDSVAQPHLNPQPTTIANHRAYRRKHRLHRRRSRPGAIPTACTIIP